MIHPEQLAPTVIEALRERGHTDTEISAMSANEAFEEWCSWHGFLGWSSSIRIALDNIRGAYDVPRS